MADRTEYETVEREGRRRYHAEQMAIAEAQLVADALEQLRLAAQDPDRSDREVIDRLIAEITDLIAPPGRRARWRCTSCWASCGRPGRRTATTRMTWRTPRRSPRGSGLCHFLYRSTGV